MTQGEDPGFALLAERIAGPGLSGHGAVAARLPALATP